MPMEFENANLKCQCKFEMPVPIYNATLEDLQDIQGANSPCGNDVAQEEIQKSKKCNFEI